MHLKTLFWGRVCRFHPTTKGVGGLWRLSRPAGTYLFWNNSNQSKTIPPSLDSTSPFHFWPVILPLRGKHLEWDVCSHCSFLFPSSFFFTHPQLARHLHPSKDTAGPPCLPWSQTLDPSLSSSRSTFGGIWPSRLLPPSLDAVLWLSGTHSPGFRPTSLWTPLRPDWLILVSPASKYYFS